MKLKELHIQNYKSLVDLKIIEPNPFSVFAGSNGAGKSNIFEALEFLSTASTFDVNNKIIGLFGGGNAILNKNIKEIKEIHFQIALNEHSHNLDLFFNEIEGDIVFNYANMNKFGNSNYAVAWNKYNPDNHETKNNPYQALWKPEVTSIDYIHFFNNFGRIFVGNSNILKLYTSDDFLLNISCSNLEKVLKRILSDKSKREEIFEWLDLLIPGFDKIDIVSETYKETDNLIIYEKGTKKPFNRKLISDGTYNILALLTAVYQSDEPQFLCIEEPENGLNPKVQKELVNLFRQKCEEEGHYIWLNTHSQTIVNQLTTKELILVDKVDGATQIKQLTDFDNHGLPMDEAWLSNSLGGGIPW